MLGVVDRLARPRQPPLKLLRVDSSPASSSKPFSPMAPYNPLVLSVMWLRTSLLSCLDLDFWNAQWAVGASAPHRTPVVGLGPWMTARLWRGWDRTPFLSDRVDRVAPPLQVKPVEQVEETEEEVQCHHRD